MIMSYLSYSVIWCGDLSCTIYSASFSTRNESRIFCQSTTHWVLEHTAEHGYSCHSRSRPVYKSPCASGNIQTGNSSHHWQEIGASWLKTLELSARFHPDAHRWAWPVQRAIMIESTGATSTRVDRRCGAQHVKVTQIPDSTSLSGPGSGFCTVVVITALHQNSKTARNSRQQSQSSQDSQVLSLFHSIAVGFHSRHDANADVMTCDVQTNAPRLRWGKTVEPTAVTAAITSCSQNARHGGHFTSDCHGHVDDGGQSNASQKVGRQLLQSIKHPKKPQKLWPSPLVGEKKSCRVHSLLSWEIWLTIHILFIYIMCDKVAP